MTEMSDEKARSLVGFMLANKTIRKVDRYKKQGLNRSWVLRRMIEVGLGDSTFMDRVVPKC